MIRETNECVGCGLPCLGISCPLRHTIRYYCDKCDTEINPTLEVPMLCEDCKKERREGESNERNNL